MRPARTLVAIGSTGAALATLHSVVNLRWLDRPSPAPRPTARRVDVLLPARNEEATIEACVRAVLASVGVDELRVVVADDDSDDATAAIVGGIDDARLSLIHLEGGPPPGWLGKPCACATLAAASEADVLVFVDADVVVAPQGIAAAIELLDGSGLDLVSPYPRQLADGILPRLVQPLLQWSWATFLPLRWAQSSPRPSTAAANGQLLVCTRESYERAGGHSAVRASVLDDVDLARAFTRAGLTCAIVDGTDVASCRMYRTGRDVIAGYEKSLWSAFGSSVGAGVVGGALATLYLVPPLAMVLTRDRRTRAIGVLGYAAAVAGRAAVARRTRSPVLPDALAHPASIAVLLAILLRSTRASRTGSLQWRGRPVRPRGGDDTRV